MAKRLIGTATTDSNGIASVSYTGTGAGKLELVAECGDVESNTYELYDCLLVDTGATADAGTFSNETGKFTRSDSGCTVYYDNSSSSSTYQTSFSDYAMTNGSECAIDMDILECSYVQIQTGRYQTGESTQYELITLQNQTGKLHIEILEDKTVFYLDNTKLAEQTQSETNLEKITLFFRVTAGNVLNFKYKDLIVYPI